MKVCIVTVYNSINSGSYWQAKALAESVQSLGHEVWFLGRRDANFTKKQQIKRIIKNLLAMNIREAIGLFKSYKKFLAYQESFSVVKYADLKMTDFDCIILGSDTIWNLNSGFFRENRDIFWGGVFNAPIIAYASSAANTSMETLIKYPELRDMVRRWSFVSVRDTASKKLIENYIDTRVDIVADPTLLLPLAYYEHLVKNNSNQPYIFLYLFEDLSKTQIKCVLDYANDNSLQVINGAGYRKYCDKNISNEPYEFLSYLMYADTVITDTFHGAVFSTNLKKRFITINRGKNKVNDFLESVGLQDRLVKDDDIKDLISRPIDYKVCYSAVEQLREKSKVFLEDALRGISNGDI